MDGASIITILVNDWIDDRCCNGSALMLSYILYMLCYLLINTPGNTREVVLEVHWSALCEPCLLPYFVQWLVQQKHYPILYLDCATISILQNEEMKKTCGTHHMTHHPENSRILKFMQAIPKVKYITSKCRHTWNMKWSTRLLILRIYAK